MQLDAAQLASKEQFDRQSHNYGTSHILADTTDVVEALTGITGRRALDVATGGGHTAVALAKLGWDVTASDLSPAMLERTQELAVQCGVKVTTTLHPAEQLPYPDSAFDLVTCRVAAHHFTAPAAFVREVARILKPGGHFLLIDGTVPDAEPVAADWIHAIEKLRDPSHGRFLSPSEWTRLCDSSDLAVERISLTPFKQPDLEWYFDTASTSPTNRNQVIELVRTAPQEARGVFRISNENGLIVWWWSRLSLLARRLAPPHAP